MKKISVTITIFLFLININAYCNPNNIQDSTRLNCVFFNATKNNDINKFFVFLEYFEKLDENSKIKFILNQDNFKRIYNFEVLNFKKQPTDSIFLVHSRIRMILINSAEYLQMVDKSFSKYIAKNVEMSISIFEKIEDNEILQNLVSSAVFREGSANKVIDYIENNGLIKKYQKTYNLFKPYKI